MPLLISKIRGLASELGIHVTDENLYSLTTYVRALASILGIGLFKNSLKTKQAQH